MKLLLLGSGGREHALAWKIAQSPKIEKLYIAPGNAGTNDIGENVTIKADDFAAIKAFVIANGIDMVVVGPEDPLVKGIYDYFKEDGTLRNVPVIGPSRKGATLEGSKEFAKGFMQRHCIPTAGYKSITADNLEEGIAFLETLQAPYVLKADGLCAGKGVLILATLDEAKKEAREILADDGKPKEEITIKLPDIPIIRKGDKIHLKTASISAGYYIVISATQDVDKMLMTLGLKKAPAAKKSSGNKKTKAKSYDVGDIVNFHGGKHYVSSYPDARGYSVGAGKAKITIKGGSGKAHPWHLVTQNWNQTHVWGWVDDGSFD